MGTTSKFLKIALKVLPCGHALSLGAGWSAEIARYGGHDQPPDEAGVFKKANITWSNEALRLKTSTAK